MKRKNIIMRMVVLFFAGALILSSCNEDKGNYDYREIDGIDLDGFDRYGYTGIKMDQLYQLQPGETLVIEPEITFIKENPDTYEYKWYAYPTPLTGSNSDNIEPVLIGNEKNLEFALEGDWSKPTEIDKELTFMLQVINPKTGIKYWRTTLVGVNLYSKTGYLALTKKANGEFDFDVVALNSGAYKVYTDVLAGLDVDIDRKAEPRDVATGWDFHFDGLYGVYLLTDKYSIRLNQKDYSYDPDRDLSKQVEPWSPLLGKDFIGTKLVMRALQSNGLGARFHFFNQDGNCYFSNTSAMSYYDAPVNRIKGTEELYDVAPHVAIMYRRTTIGQNTSAMLFNNDLPGFMVHEGISGASHTSRPLEAANAGAGYQDANYFMMFKDTENPNDELVYMHDDFAILKSKNSSEYRIVMFTLIPSGINLDGTAAAVANNNSNVFRAYLPASLQNVKHWVFKNDTNGGMLFCATDTEIYALNLKNLTRCWSRTNANFAGNEIGGAVGATWQWTAARFKNITSEIIKPGSPYTKITCLKKVADQKLNHQKLLQLMLEEDGTIVLATCDPNGEVGKNGQLQFFNYDSVQEKLVEKEMTTEDGTTTNTFTGMGEVITVSYKL